MVPFASWSVLTADFLIVLHLTISGVTLCALLHLASAKWRYNVRPFAASLFGLYWLAFALLLILLALGRTTFPWLGADSHEHLNGWHSYGFLVAREVGGLAFVGWLYSRFLRLQAVSETSTENWERFKSTAIAIPFTHVIYGTMVAWDFEMTLQPSWESSVYGMYHFVSNFGMSLAFLVAMIRGLDRSGRAAVAVPERIYNYIAQMMLAFTILWTYLYFAQYLTIWYGNLPEERNRIESMLGGDYSALWWSFLALKFMVPFSMLIFTYVRHSPGATVFVACSIMLGTWIERFTWIAGSYPTGPFERGHQPMTSAFDVLVTAAVAVVGYLLLRRALMRNGAIGPNAVAAESPV
jgi:hypothetical protein